MGAIFPKNVLEKYDSSELLVVNKTKKSSKLELNNTV